MTYPLGSSAVMREICYMSQELQTCLKRIRACKLCKADMSRPPRPVLQASASAKILIAGQAPGNRVFESGRPFTDPSGDRLREWMQISEEDFYDETKVAIVPMGFCFPGYDKNGGDIPPMKRCAEEWRSQLLELLPNIQLTLLIGGYAQKWHLEEKAAKTLTATVQNWRDFLSEQVITTPHPSWRNNGWLKRNPWFESDLLPELQARVRSLLQPA